MDELVVGAICMVLLGCMVVAAEVLRVGLVLVGLEVSSVVGTTVVNGELVTDVVVGATGVGVGLDVSAAIRTGTQTVSAIPVQLYRTGVLVQLVQTLH
jgi:hypothetical protein